MLVTCKTVLIFFSWTFYFVAVVGKNRKGNIGALPYKRRPHLHALHSSNRSEMADIGSFISVDDTDQRLDIIPVAEINEERPQNNNTNFVEEVNMLAQETNAFENISLSSQSQEPVAQVSTAKTTAHLTEPTPSHDSFGVVKHPPDKLSSLSEQSLSNKLPPEYDAHNFPNFTVPFSIISDYDSPTSNSNQTDDINAYTSQDTQELILRLDGENLSNFGSEKAQLPFLDLVYTNPPKLNINEADTQESLATSFETVNPNVFFNKPPIHFSLAEKNLSRSVPFDTESSSQTNAYDNSDLNKSASMLVPNELKRISSQLQKASDNLPLGFLADTELNTQSLLDDAVLSSSENETHSLPTNAEPGNSGIDTHINSNAPNELAFSPLQSHQPPIDLDISHETQTYLLHNNPSTSVPPTENYSPLATPIDVSQTKAPLISINDKFDNADSEKAPSDHGANQFSNLRSQESSIGQSRANFVTKSRGSLVGLFVSTSISASNSPIDTSETEASGLPLTFEPDSANLNPSTFSHTSFTVPQFQSRETTLDQPLVSLPARFSTETGELFGSSFVPFLENDTPVALTSVDASGLSLNVESNKGASSDQSSISLSDRFEKGSGGWISSSITDAFQRNQNLAGQSLPDAENKGLYTGQFKALPSRENDSQIDFSLVNDTQLPLYSSVHTQSALQSHESSENLYPADLQGIYETENRGSIAGSLTSLPTNEYYSPISASPVDVSPLFLYPESGNTYSNSPTSTSPLNSFTSSQLPTLDSSGDEPFVDFLANSGAKTEVLLSGSLTMENDSPIVVSLVDESRLPLNVESYNTDVPMPIYTQPVNAFTRVLGYDSAEGQSLFNKQTISETERRDTFTSLLPVGNDTPIDTSPADISFLTPYSVSDADLNTSTSPYNFNSFTFPQLLIYDTSVNAPITHTQPNLETETGELLGILSTSFPISENNPPIDFAVVDASGLPHNIEFDNADVDTSTLLSIPYSFTAPKLKSPETDSDQAADLPSSLETVNGGFLGTPSSSFPPNERYSSFDLSLLDENRSLLNVQSESTDVGTPIHNQFPNDFTSLPSSGGSVGQSVIQMQTISETKGKDSLPVSLISLSTAENDTPIDASLADDSVLAQYPESDLNTPFLFNFNSFAFSESQSHETSVSESLAVVPSIFQTEADRLLDSSSKSFLARENCSLTDLSLADATQLPPKAESHDTGVDTSVENYPQNLSKSESEGLFAGSLKSLPSVENNSHIEASAVDVESDRSDGNMFIHAPNDFVALQNPRSTVDQTQVNMSTSPGSEVRESLDGSLMALPSVVIVTPMYTSNFESDNGDFVPTHSYTLNLLAALQLKSHDSPVSETLTSALQTESRELLGSSLKLFPSSENDSPIDLYQVETSRLPLIAASDNTDMDTSVYTPAPNDQSFESAVGQLFDNVPTTSDTESRGSLAGSLVSAPSIKKNTPIDDMPASASLLPLNFESGFDSPTHSHTLVNDPVADIPSILETGNEGSLSTSSSLLTPSESYSQFDLSLMDASRLLLITQSESTDADTSIHNQVSNKSAMQSNEGSVDQSMVNLQNTSEGEGSLPVSLVSSLSAENYTPIDASLADGSLLPQYPESGNADFGTLPPSYNPSSFAFPQLRSRDTSVSESLENLSPILESEADGLLGSLSTTFLPEGSYSPIDLSLVHASSLPLNIGSDNNHKSLVGEIANLEYLPDAERSDSSFKTIADISSRAPTVLLLNDASALPNTMTTTTLQCNEASVAQFFVDSPSISVDTEGLPNGSLIVEPSSKYFSSIRTHDEILEEEPSPMPRSDASKSPVYVSSAVISLLSGSLEVDMSTLSSAPVEISPTPLEYHQLSPFSMDIRDSSEIVTSGLQTDKLVTRPSNENVPHLQTFMDISAVKSSPVTHDVITDNLKLATLSHAFQPNELIIKKLPGQDSLSSQSFGGVETISHFPPQGDPSFDFRIPIPYVTHTSATSAPVNVEEPLLPTHAIVNTDLSTDVKQTSVDALIPSNPQELTPTVTRVFPPTHYDDNNYPPNIFPAIEATHMITEDTQIPSELPPNIDSPKYSEPPSLFSTKIISDLRTFDKSPLMENNANMLLLLNDSNLILLLNKSFTELSSVRDVAVDILKSKQATLDRELNKELERATTVFITYSAFLNAASISKLPMYAPVIEKTSLLYYSIVASFNKAKMNARIPRDILLKSSELSYSLQQRVLTYQKNAFFQLGRAVGQTYTLGNTIGTFHRCIASSRVAEIFEESVTKKLDFLPLPDIHPLILVPVMEFSHTNSMEFRSSNELLHLLNNT